MYFQSVIILSVLGIASFSNLNYNIRSDRNYVRNIIAVFHSSYGFPHASVICDEENDFCDEICAAMQTISIPIRIFKIGNSSVEAFGKLNIFYFQSDENLLSFIRSNYVYLGSDSYCILFLTSSEVWNVMSTLWIEFKIRRAILFDKFDSYDGYIYDITSSTLKIINVGKTVSKHLFRLQNFHRIPIRAILFERVPEVIRMDGKLYGPNYKLIELLSHKLNFTADIHRSSDGKKFGTYVNGKYNGGLADIVYGKSDIACNGYFIQKTHTKEYKYLFPMNMDYVCLVTPKAGKIPKYMAPFKCFPGEVWLAMVLTFICVSVARYFMRYVHRNYLNWDENSNYLLAIFSISINMPISFSQYKYLSSRIILIIFLSQMYVIVTSFQGSLVMLLSVPKYYKDMDTLEELSRSNMEIKTGSSTIGNVFKQDSTLKVVANRIKKVKDGDFRNFNFSFFARFTHHKEKLFRTFSIKKENRSVLVHRLTECPLLYYTSFVIGWNFPFVEEFNSLIARVIESGFIIKWDNEIMSNIIKEFEPEIKLRHSDEQTENKTFTLNDLEVAFIVLVLGCCGSICIFIGEIIGVERFDKKTQKKLF